FGSGATVGLTWSPHPPVSRPFDLLWPHLPYGEAFLENFPQRAFGRLFGGRTDWGIRVRARTLLVMAIAAVLAGRSSGKRTEELQGSALVNASVTDIAGNHAIFVATTRERSKDPKKVFAGGRSAVLNFARVNVTVPKSHEPGRIERKGRGASDDPAKYFMVSEVVGYDSPPKFQKAIDVDMAARGGRALIFVHGYNTGFDDAVYRLTQIAHDSGYPGTPVLFSWASGDSTTSYVYDKESAAAARDQLEVTLR